GRARQSFAPAPGQVKSITQNALDAAPGEDHSLLGDLVRRALLETPAPAAVFAFRIFAHTDEINLAAPLVTQWTLRSGEQFDRAQIDVLVEVLADFDQQVAQADVVGHARRIADGAEVDRREILQTSQSVGVHHPPGFQIIIAAPGKLFGFEFKAATARSRAQHV